MIQGQHTRIRQLKLTEIEKQTDLTEMADNLLLPAPVGVLIFVVYGDQPAQGALCRKGKPEKIFW